jgi:hypothetical protein
MRPGQKKPQGKEKLATMVLLPPRGLPVVLACLLLLTGGARNDAPVAAEAQSTGGQPCTSDTNEFHMRVNLFAGEL